ncbi:protein phosphatase 1 regulatory subunit 12A isoform X2 [Callorhinchus milii]|uniref:protein phosphatase 1 regulatory subunit 12A isoform X2 n=1 Tax=Callorhinchus milii TaxID=7868 RepID=UPI00045749D1|nr:protein phosphatase 1 regulatory subunit 12A isoform X2 [Callorhinchus milii]|eukprot:gi/632955620/ref/XP_007893552.1/ PREDICTED: protein phosphatase 1 regulatory subunit 12A isoform X3 [Callorhinchus milii]
MADAKQKRNEQLKRWLGSETELESPVFKKKKTKVKFDNGAVFLAACSSGDTDEVKKLLDRGSDINYANVDGLTALHQACIDDNLDMVKFLVEHGANINQPDNEGWIPLHAAASCGYVDIAEYLISHEANVAAVNSEGETPLDIAEEESMEELLREEINRQGVDIESARKEEERIMLRDARQWLNSGQINDVRHPKSGGTALHVAAAKGYTEVLKLLIQAGYDVNIKDYDGWTPLHASAHWGKAEACRILVEHFCDMEAINKVGQTAFDVADEDVLRYLEELHKKQSVLLSEKPATKSPLIESTTTLENNQQVKLVKNKEALLNEQKNAAHIEALEQEKVDEEEEGKKDDSSCSSEEEEEEDSESEAESEKSKPTVPVNIVNHTNSGSIQSASVAPSTVSTNQVAPTSPVKKFTTPFTKPKEEEKKRKDDEEKKDASPASWRSGLRKTGSYGALAEISASKEGQKERDPVGVMRSASSPRLSSSLDNKDKEKDQKGTKFAYIAPTIPSRRLASTSDVDDRETRDSATILTRCGSYTRRRWEDDLKKKEVNHTSTPEGSTSQNAAFTNLPVVPSYQRSNSYLLAIGRSSSARDLPANSSSAISLDSTNFKSRHPPSAHYSSYNIYKSSSFGKRKEDLIGPIPSNKTSATTLTTVTSSNSLQSTTSTKTPATTSLSSTSNRFSTGDNAEREKESVPSALASTGTGSTTEVRERRRSYLTPVRDEESESQRKARSRQARQSRRSTQGVTLTDLQEAEKSIGRSRVDRRTREQEEKEKEEKEKQDREKQEDKKEMESRDDRQRFTRNFEEPYQRIRPITTSSSTAPVSTTSSSIYSVSQINRPNSLIGITSAYSPYSRSSRDIDKEGERKEDEKDGEERLDERSQNKPSIRDRRRPREKRRSTGVSYWTQDSDENDQEQQSDTDDRTSKESQNDRLSRFHTGYSSTGHNDGSDLLVGRATSYSYREGRLSSQSRAEKDDTLDYKKLYEQFLSENEKLKAKLHDTNLELTELKVQLEKATQRHERIADRSLLEMEKRIFSSRAHAESLWFVERRALERKISEMEEELKMLPDLKADNQRLKDENGALIRVISKLSK